jgi:heavy metal sensor kinase
VRRLLAPNLRTRLTVFYSLLLVAALLLYAVGVSVFFLHNLREEVDASIDRDLETVEGNLFFASNGQIELNSHEGEPDEDEPDRGYFLEVWDREGALLHRTAQLNGQALGQAPGSESAHSHREAISSRLPSGMRVRMMTRPHHMPGGKSVFVRLAVSEKPLWREFWEMVTVLGIGLPLVVIPIFVTGYFVASKALSPVDSMARRAAEITAEQLHERLEIRNPDDELGQLGTAFNATLARLENSFEQLRRFTADASHELRTPLTAIRSVGEVSLQKGGDSTYYRDIIGSMLEETNRLTRLVDSLLTMSRADAGRITLQMTAVSLLDLATEAAGLLEVLAEEREQTLHVEGTGSTLVNADRTILRQALVNLIDNAVKFSPLKGDIHIRVFDEGTEAVLEVRDSGLGISSEHQQKIFERFYRIDKARTRSEGGAGLGLSIAQWAVSVHRGTIEVKSEPGAGSIFRIRLPKLAATKSAAPRSAI